MKPLRIQITNLGAIPHADIDLAGITCAAIAGPNGAGKSTAFTIAPMFALFGTTKAGTSADDMVRTGTSEAAVTFDFDHQGSVWRVIRTRSTKGKGKSTLELQRQSGELWAGESGASIAETQKKIIALLGLDEETFSSSSMILQGRANEFTSRPAGQRKAILAQILQLDQYEGLQERSRARMNAAALSLERDKGTLASLETKLAEQPAIAEKLEHSRLQLTDMDVKEEVSQELIDSERVILAELKTQEQDAAVYKKRAEELRDEAEEKKLAREAQKERLHIAAVYLLEEETILAKADEYERIRDQVTALQTKDDQRKTLAIDGDKLHQELDQVNESLEKVLKEISNTEKLLATRPALEEMARQQNDVSNKLTAYDIAKTSYEDHAQRLADVDSEILIKTYRMDTEAESRVKEIRSFEERAVMLQNAECLDIEHANCKFLADAKKAAAKAKELQDEYDSWHDEQLLTITNLTGQREGILMSQKVIGYDPDEHAKAKNQYEDVMSCVLRLKSLEGIAKLLDNLNAQRVDLEVRQVSLTEKLQTLREAYRILNDELAELPKLSEQLQVLAPFVKRKELLPAVKEKEKLAIEQIAVLTAEIDSLTEKANTNFALYVDTVPSDAQFEIATSSINEWQLQLDNIRRSKSDTTLQIGALQATLDAMARDSVERDRILERMDPLAKELNRWQLLVKAFGRDGIPALIIENAVPELERIANEILGQMSGGKHNLRFETQRELKSRTGMAETLDIIVGDWAGERIYETFSGGEQLRIDFAIRFALAELLARRAGARVDWLTIDEGFGSQSDEYLPLVLDAVKSVANRFGMVLVISHVKQVQEAFEQTILFRPEGEAVEVKVA